MAEFRTVHVMIRAKVGLGGIVSAGLKMRLPASCGLAAHAVQVPALYSSLLDYRVEDHCHPQKRELFAHCSGQSVSDPHESKFSSMSMRGQRNLACGAPYMPPAISEQNVACGRIIHLWTDPTSDSTVDISSKSISLAVLAC